MGSRCEYCGSERVEEYGIGHSKKKYKRLIHERGCKKFVAIRRRGGGGEEHGGED